MTTASDLEAILDELRRKIKESRRFHKELAEQIKDIDTKLEKLQSEQKKNKR